MLTVYDVLEFYEKMLTYHDFMGVYIVYTASYKYLYLHIYIYMYIYIWMKMIDVLHK